MKRSLGVVSFVATTVLSATFAFPQAFGEYGRTLGGVPPGLGFTGSKAPGGGIQGSAGPAGIRAFGLRTLPPHFAVATMYAGLYPREEDDPAMLFELPQGA